MKKFTVNVRKFPAEETLDRTFECTSVESGMEMARELLSAYASGKFKVRITNDESVLVVDEIIDLVVDN